LHIKPLALQLSCISVQAFGELEACSEGWQTRLQALLSELDVVSRDCEGLQGGDGALVLIALKLNAQVSRSP
jgi:hypothetical protein